MVLNLPTERDMDEMPGELGWKEEINHGKELQKLCADNLTLLQIIATKANPSLTELLSPLYDIERKLTKLTDLSEDDMLSRNSLLRNVQFVSKKVREDTKEGQKLLSSLLPLLENISRTDGR